MYCVTRNKKHVNIKTNTVFLWSVGKWKDDKLAPKAEGKLASVRLSFVCLGAFYED